MQRLAGALVYSASDLNNFTECEHLGELDRAAARGDITRPERTDATAELLARKGEAHERHYLERLKSEYGDRLVEFTQRPEADRASLAAAEAATIEAMAAGAEVIYQATFFDGTFSGRADFLRRVPRPSARWPWSYEVVDTKLALSPKPYFLIQLCNYSEHVERIAGTAPENAAIVLGTGAVRTFRLADYAAYYRRLKAAFLSRAGAVAEALPQTYPFECAHCDFCPWRDACARRRDADDHLSIVAGLRRDQLDKLQEARIPTLAALAKAGDRERPRRLSREAFENLRAQATEQHRYREARRGSARAEHSYSFKPLQNGRGLTRLPAPDRGDVFFDMEGDPLYRPDRALEYLFGVYTPDDDRFTPFWGLNPREERMAFESFVDFVGARRERYPDLHVYHYAPYEVSALKRLMGRFASRENEIDDFLRQGVFVDLYQVVRQTVWISQPSYSIKKVEALYGWTRHTQTKAGDDSIVMFESWLDSGDPALLEDIRAYNEDDCRSTHALHAWLLRLRGERIAGSGMEIPWRQAPAAAENSEPLQRSETEARLLAGLPELDSLADLRRADETVRGRYLLGHLAQFHRREQKPDWWEYFHRLDSIDELQDHDRKAIAGLELCADVAPYKRTERDQNLVYTYWFPEQEYDFVKNPVSPYTKKPAGKIIAIDERRQLLAIKLARGIEPALLRAIIPGKPIPDKKKREAIEFISCEYLGGTLETDYRATFDLLLGRRPRLRGRGPGAPLVGTTLDNESVSAAIAALDRSYLFIQGPPGSGKSTTAASAIVDLLQAGKRVAIGALSHKAVHALLRKIERTAYERRFSFRGSHRATETDDSDYEPLAAWPMIGNATDGASTASQLVSGTTYAWAEAAERRAFDYVVIDEAGQISLADALVASLVAPCAVLLGDPQQLPQVAAGFHPLGASQSVLEHLLGGKATIPRDRGIFLETSYRMQPAINEFVSDAMYEGRLHFDAANAGNRVEVRSGTEAGLVYVPIAHDGNSRVSIEEARYIVDEIAAHLADGYVSVANRPKRRITQGDILVVAPYNSQRLKISELLQAAGYGNVRVGTVDKFQGQEAPIVFYSLATSSARDAPRGIDFLFNANRFNVAISRAQVTCFLVCSPSLLRSRVATPEAMRLVNLLCLYAERADVAVERRTGTLVLH